MDLHTLRNQEFSFYKLSKEKASKKEIMSWNKMNFKLQLEQGEK